MFAETKIKLFTDMYKMHIDEALPLFKAEIGRLTSQLTLERTTSNRTIAHLVARKDALEAEVLVWQQAAAGRVTS